MNPVMSLLNANKQKVSIPNLKPTANLSVPKQANVSKFLQQQQRNFQDKIVTDEVMKLPNILDQPELQANPTVDSPHAYLQSKEGSGNTYTTKNTGGSSAYGMFQFMPKTAKAFATELGIDPNQWTTPANQNAIMNYAKKTYIKDLNNLGVDPTESNQYVVHQLGQPRASRYFNNTLTAKDVQVMNDNLPAKYKGSNKMDIVGNWTRLYNQ